MSTDLPTMDEVLSAATARYSPDVLTRALAERDRQVAEQASERIAAALVLTDAEWREFQQIPDQGYSHRAWLDARAARIARADTIAPSRPTTDDREALIRHLDRFVEDCAAEGVGKGVLSVEWAGRLRDALASRPTTPAPTVSECDHAKAAREIARTTPLALDAATALIDSLARGTNTLADAWDEGHKVGWEHCRDGNYGNDYWDDDTANPFRTTMDGGEG